jgi:hypothetical protein
MKSILNFDLHPIYTTLLGLSLLSWATIAYFYLTEPETSLLSLLLWVALGITTLAGLWRWQKERVDQLVETPEQIISRLGGPLVGWNFRKEQINKTVHNYAMQTALNDFGIKTVGQVINLASHTIFGTVAASAWAIKRKWGIYEAMPRDLALHLLGNEEAPPTGFSLAASGSGEMIDLAIDYLFDNFVTEAFDDIVSNALDDVLHDLTLSDFIPFLGPVKSGGVAYVYTWIVGFIYLAVLLNFSLAENADEEEIDADETRALVAASRELLNDHILKIGPVRVPIPWKNVELERVLEMDEIQEPIRKRLLALTRQLRTQYPHLTAEKVEALYLRANFPRAAVEKAIEANEWRKSRPNPLQSLQFQIWH